MMRKKGKLFVFSAPSGTGKTTIVRHLLRELPQLKFSVSATTRKPRANETNGVDYYFISEEEFKNKIENGEFIEWGKFYDYLYGTLKHEVEKDINNGNNILLELDVKGALEIKKAYPDSVTIFIAPPSIEELISRLKKRNTETEEDFKKRIERAEMELGYKEKFDYLVVNDELEKAKKEAKEIIIKEIERF